MAVGYVVVLRRLIVIIFIVVLLVILLSRTIGILCRIYTKNVPVKGSKVDRVVG